MDGLTGKPSFLMWNPLACAVRYAAEKKGMSWVASLSVRVDSIEEALDSQDVDIPETPRPAHVDWTNFGSPGPSRLNGDFV